MQTVQCTCTNCNISFNKPKNEYTRAVKINRNFFCSRTCAGKFHLRNLRKGGASSDKRPKGHGDPFLYYYRNCKRRHYEVNITLEYLKEVWESQKHICPYTGIELVLNSHTKRTKDYRYTASLDRIDSSKGYIEGNVQFVSTAINFMKNTMTHEQTVEFLKLISTHYTGFPIDQTISSSHKDVGS